MLQNKNGFTIVESLFAISVVLIIGCGGWYIYHKDSKSNSLQASHAKAQLISNQVFKDVLADNAQAIYDISSPSVKSVATESDMARLIKNTRMSITSNAMPKAKVSYPTKNIAQFIYNVQTKRKYEPLVIQLQYINNQWTAYTVILNP